jgi:hypothetical protein
MLSKIWIINTILLLLIGICWINIFSSRHVDVNPVSEIGTGGKAAEIPEKPKMSEKKLTASEDYDVIVEKNLFSQDRAANIAEQKAQPAVEDLRISGEKIMLFGVVMMGGYKSALINNPNKDKDARDYKWVKEGDHISNLNVVRIQKDQIMLSDGATKYKVSLFDPDKEKKVNASSTVREEPKVISAGASGSGKAQAPAAQTGSSTPEGRRGESKPGGAPSSSLQKKVGVSADGQYEIIDTPLGKFERKIKK